MNTPDQTPRDLPIKWIRMNHKSPDHMSRYPYFGYGSNLSLAQMTQRCPEADIVGSGVLNNSELFFAFYAGIKEVPGKVTPGGVYKLNARDIATMDRREGMGRSYDRFLVTVDMSDGTKLRCFTYVKWNRVIEAPSKHYLETVTQGYRDWDLPMVFLKDAAAYAEKQGVKRKPSTSYSSPSYSRQWGATRTTATNVNTYSSGSRWCSTCFKYDCTQHSRAREPDGKFVPRISLVTGRDLNGIRTDDDAGYDPGWYDEDQMDWVGPTHRQALPVPYKPKLPFSYMTNPERNQAAEGQETYTHNGEKWAKGSDNVWRRVKK